MEYEELEAYTMSRRPTIAAAPLRGLPTRQASPA
jgi:hypothetical protein